MSCREGRVDPEMRSAKRTTLCRFEICPDLRNSHTTLRCTESIHFLWPQQLLKMKRKQKGWRNFFVKIHKSDNISENGKRGRERTLEQYKELIQSEEYYNDQINITFTKTELNRSLRKTKKSAPGMDQICYLMINHLSELSKDVLLKMYNKIWEEGKIPQSWKESVIVPIRKPGKDCTNPGNYRPIALTSNVGKIMKKMVNERLMYHVENNNFFSKYQSGFRRGRNTMDPAVCLEHEIRKAQINRERVVAVFFDIEKAYDMMWREGLLIKLCKLGIKGQMYRWINNFLSGRAIKVRIGNSYSEKFVIEN